MPRWIALAGVALVLATGCGRDAARTDVYRTRTDDPNRNTEKARAENGKAADLIEEANLEDAETALRAALAADLFFGPAHNNLGVVYFRQKAYYRAAWEFQYAAKLMPHSPEPRNNLGLVYEAVGQMGKAERWFDEALSLGPDNPELIGNLARVRVRSGRRDEGTRQVLQNLVLKDTRQEWVAWARQRLAVMPRTEDAESGEGPPSTPRNGTAGPNTVSTPAPARPSSVPDKDAETEPVS